MSSWSKDHLLGFIEEFRKHECVWKVKSKDYHNRDKKEAAYRCLLLIVKCFDKNATKSDVLKKINNIRSAFRKEQKKVVASQCSGSGADDIYVPKLWYYRDLLFLIDQEEVLGGTSNLAEGRNSEDEQYSEEELQKFVSIQYLEDNESTSPIRDMPVETHLGRPLNRRIDECDSGIKETEQQSKNPTSKYDRCDVFAEYVASRMKCILDNKQRLIAEKLINNTLFMAEMGQLTMSHSISDQASTEISKPQDICRNTSTFIVNGTRSNSYSPHYSPS